MRKDVRFGLTIGAILLAVLVVYILVVPANKPAAVTLETLNPDGTVAQPVVPTEAEDLRVDASSTASVTTADNPVSVSVADVPDVTRTPAVASGSDDVNWDQLLSRGWAAAGIETRTPRADEPTARVQSISFDRTESPAAANPIPVAAPIVPTIVQTDRQPVSSELSESSSSYTVASGDSLWKISQKVFGDGRYHTEIAAANPGLNPSRLKVGQEIKLPDRTKLPSANSSSEAVSTAASSTPNATKSVSIDPARQYRVASGDSLHRIARKLYGNSAMADEIYQLNQQLIGADPAKIKVGMILQVPEIKQTTAGR